MTESTLQGDWDDGWVFDIGRGGNSTGKLNLGKSKVVVIKILREPGGVIIYGDNTV